MASYRVEYERDEAGWWVARVRGVTGCVTQGRTVAEARRRIRDALRLFVRGASRARLLDDVRLPAKASGALARLSAAEIRAEHARAAAADARAAAAHALLRPPLGLSVRDAAEILGLSHQRVQQLKARSRARASTGRGASTKSAPRGSGIVAADGAGR